MRWNVDSMVGHFSLCHGMNRSRPLIFTLLLGLTTQGAVGADPQAPNAAKPAGEGPCPQPALLQKAIVPQIDTEQTKLNNIILQPNGMTTAKASGYSFQTILINGRHLFTTPFTEADGAGEGKRFSNGEGPVGPREAAFTSNLKLIQGKLGLPDSDIPKLLDIFLPSFAHLDSQKNVRFAILRLNGLDSQSCFECHNSIGSAHVGGEGPIEALERKPGTNGGPAGQASNAFINDTLPNPITKFVRNPPHVFGTGYVVAIAQKMTIDLIGQKIGAYFAAAQSPNQEVSADLFSTDSKGRPVVRFGNFKVKYVGKPGSAPDPTTLLKYFTTDADASLPDFIEDTSGLLGVSSDLAVRPLQWKGIASNERNFVRSAMSFHFGLLPRELNPDYGLPQENHDSDNDGVDDEVSEGNVSALSIFTLSLRPPGQLIAEGKKEIVERGEKLFRGEKVDDKTIVIGAANACISCHIPSLPLYNSVICVRDPRDDVNPSVPQGLSNITGLVARQRSSKQLPVLRSLRSILQKTKPETLNPQRAKLGNPADQAKADFETFRMALHAAIEPIDCPESGYQFDLNMAAGSAFEALSFSYPRLASSKDHDGTTVINVPLFSDLKRHDMGEGLSDKFDQGTDVATINVTRREFLTRPLWGVGDTGPWLHDGRARNLRDAVLMHESLGSEANPVIETFKSLSCDDQAAIVEFLLSLRLSIDCRYQPCFDKADNCRPSPLPQPRPAT
jgi:hypothetical protein